MLVHHVWTLGDTTYNTHLVHLVLSIGDSPSSIILDDYLHCTVADATSCIFLNHDFLTIGNSTLSTIIGNYQSFLIGI